MSTKEKESHRIARFFGIRLRRLREAINIRQTELSEIIGLPSYMINRFEHGNSNSVIKAPSAIKIAQFFEVPVDWLLSSKDDEHEPLPVSEEHLRKVKARNHLRMALRCLDVDEKMIPETLEELERILRFLMKWDEKGATTRS